jgi:hypothetical protein
VSLSADNGLDWTPEMISSASKVRRSAMLQTRYSTS